MCVFKKFDNFTKSFLSFSCLLIIMPKIHCTRKFLRDNNHHFKPVSPVARQEDTTRGRAKLSFPKELKITESELEQEVTQRSLNLNFIFYGHENGESVIFPDLLKNHTAIYRQKQLRSQAFLLLSSPYFSSQQSVLRSESLGKPLPSIDKPLH